ncbi:MAG TPA: PAN domain-containing protein [Geminicoccaceae bacterium]|nr:PAN domain-containing protein [Geminicoccaceae bacterium]
MPKVIRIGALFAIVGIALTAQGCWDENPHELTFLGEGGCRTADGGEGPHVTLAASSSDECQAHCFSGKQACVAVEFNSTNNSCEIHSKPITSFAKAAGVSCYVVN